MKIYRWKGIDYSGASCKGTLTADSPSKVKKQLLEEKIALLSCSEKKPFLQSLKIFFSEQLKEQELFFFFDQLSIQLEHGIHLAKALPLLYENTNHQKLKALTAFLITKIHNGLSLSQALTSYPDLNFPYLYVIQAGEIAGSLAQSLKQVAAILERNISLKATIKTAIRMPLFTFFFACIIITALIIFVIPQFATLFDSLDKPLPSATRYLIAISAFISSAWGIAIAAIGTIAFSTGMWLTRTSTTGKRLLEQYLLNSFIFGNLKKLTYGVAILDLTSTLLQAGVPLKQAMHIVHETYKSPFLSPRLESIVHSLEQGLPLHESFQTHLPTIFPNTIIALLYVGEQTGNLSHMLKKSASLLFKTLTKQLTFITTIIQPVFLITIGLIIVFMMTCIYLPIFHMADII